MKKCNRCEETKPLDEFNKKGKNRLQSYCRPCQQKDGRERYHLDRENNAIKQNQNKKVRMDGIKADIRRLKEQNPCLDCGKHYAWYVMDYDHVKDRKSKPISELVREGAARWRIFSEITKCELVCSNCHRERTFSRANLTTEIGLDNNE
jgi:hypothetical protein